MTRRIVDIEALNLRSAPVVTPATRIAILHLGQSVDELGPASDPAWVRVSAVVEGAATNGVVKAEIDGQPSLRDPVSAAREALVAQCIREWLRFDQGQGAEHLDPYYRYVGEMWQAIGIDLDGRDRDIPWSAAAVSFMVRNAGAAEAKYRKFKFAPGHSRYMHDSIVRRRNNDSTVPFWGYRLNEKRPQIGDIACKWRVNPVDYDYAAAHDSFQSHTDIIVSVKADHVLAIGGNVRQSVSISRYAKTGAGFLAADSPVIMMMANQT